MPEYTITGFNGHLDKFVKELGNDALTRFGRQVGKQAIKIADAEAARDVGSDRKHSGWGVVLDTKAVQLAPGVVSIRPTPRSAGPWTVATVGRNQMQGPGVMASGKTRRTKKGNVRKVARRRRWNGQTQGKGTADRAVAQMESIVPVLAQAEVAKTIGRFFG